ncbi:MAG: hypothetical protein U0836_06485 [Pirellulales bacterium]
MVDEPEIAVEIVRVQAGDDDQVAVPSVSPSVRIEVSVKLAAGDIAKQVFVVRRNIGAGEAVGAGGHRVAAGKEIMGRPA